MVIRRSEDWGRVAIAPSDLVCASSDAELAAHVGEGQKNVVVTGGDMWRTIGADSRVVVSGESATCLPIDVMKVEYQLEDQSIVSKIAVSNIVVRPTSVSGGWLRGSLTVVANAQFLGRWDVAPRGHPNDGRVEVTQVDCHMGVRQRLTARSRLSTGSHLPHPLIQTRSLKNFVCESDDLAQHALWLDGQYMGRVTNLSCEVCSDEAFLWM